MQLTDGLYKGPDGEALRFYEEPVRNNHLSETNGRPIYDTALMVEVTTPGSRECTPCFVLETKYAEETGITEPVRTERYEKYKPAIEAFRSGTSNAELSGTPLTSWPAIETAQIAALKEARIFTVDGLAALSDEKLRVLGPGGRTLRERAQTYLAAAAGNAPVERLTSENVELRERIAQLETMVQTLGQKPVETVTGATIPPPVQPAASPPPAAPSPAPATSAAPAALPPIV